MSSHATGQSMTESWILLQQEFFVKVLRGEITKSNLQRLLTRSVEKSNDFPTFSQIKELFDQISSGAISELRFRAFINGEIAEKQTNLTIISHERVREIMGENFFGVEEAIKYYKINPTSEQLAALSEIPFSLEAVQECKNTHILVAKFPVSILDVRGKVQDKKLFYGQDIYHKQSFAKERGETEWQLVRKNIVPDSTSKNWEEQKALLSKDETVPTAQVMIYTIIGHYLATGERLFKNIYVRTSTVDSDGSRVLVGYFDSYGLDVDYYWDDDRDGNLGLSSARK